MQIRLFAVLCIADIKLTLIVKLLGQNLSVKCCEMQKFVLHALTQIHVLWYNKVGIRECFLNLEGSFNYTPLSW